MKYTVPKKYHFRIHHVRSRFKGDVENVLIYFAQKLTALGSHPTDEFVKKFNITIRQYPGNAHRKEKTINNWRTEISSLFGFIQENNGITKVGLRAVELAQKQDLVEFFKSFLFSFQYPGAHIKTAAIQEQIEYGVHFKPAQYILKLLKYACKTEKISIGITKSEVCHCIFNDLRCTRDNEFVSVVWERIKLNRKNKCTYDETGDVIRYAGDIIDYMEIANLLKTYDGRTYYLNALEEDAIIKFVESSEWFTKYDACQHIVSATPVAQSVFPIHFLV